jgi:predicted DNA-binding protein (UPF0251 family)
MLVRERTLQPEAQKSQPQELLVQEQALKSRAQQEERVSAQRAAEKMPVSRRTAQFEVALAREQTAQVRAERLTA